MPSRSRDVAGVLPSGDFADEFAGAVLFPASSDASAVTGVALSVDGGSTQI